MKKIISLFLWISASINIYAQNENTKWYFGVNASLDFMTNPPTVPNNSDMLANEGCSSIADAAGNLLFYTNGVTVWNKQHTIMTNGTGLFGGLSTAQSVLIIKHSGNSNLYHVFTISPSYFATPPGSITGLYYSIVDISLAAGMGSVTVKNAPVYNSPCTEQLHATKHANGVDYWIMVHEYSSTNNFRAYLLTSAGVNTTAIVSSVGTIYGSINQGSIKFSPTGQKLCAAINPFSVELFDFDNNTGAVSNSLTLLSTIAGYYGCEFSPDGTKLYAGNDLYNPNSNSRLTQWDLSAGSSSAIVSSSVNFISNLLAPGTLQLAPNGKIYLTSRDSSQYISVIHNPNSAGNACNLVVGGQPISAAINATLNSYARIGLPNMITSITNTPCVTQTVSNPQSICAGNFYAISGHTHTTAGTYIDTLQNVFGCNGIVIVNTQLTVNNLPNINVSAVSTICVNEPITLTASGANTYTWNNSATGSQYTTSAFTTTGNVIYSVQLQGKGNAGCVATNTVSVSVLVQACDVGFTEYRNSNQTKIYPNPVNEILNIEFKILNAGDRFQLSIQNSLGQTIREEELSFKDGKTSIDTKDMANGVYLLNITSGCTVAINRRFVINR